MRKLLFLIIAMCLLLLPAFASATVMTISQCEIVKNEEWTNKQRMIEIKLTLETDGTDQDEFVLTSYCTPDTELGVCDKTEWQGGLFWDVVTDQGTTAPEVYTVTFDNEKGASILSVTTLSVSEAEVWDAANDKGYNIPIWDLQIDFGDVGDSGEDVILYIRILK